MCIFEEKENDSQLLPLFQSVFKGHLRDAVDEILLQPLVTKETEFKSFK